MPSRRTVLRQAILAGYPFQQPEEPPRGDRPMPFRRLRAAPCCGRRSRPAIRSSNQKNRPEETD